MGSGHPNRWRSCRRFFYGGRRKEALVCPNGSLVLQFGNLRLQLLLTNRSFDLGRSVLQFRVNVPDNLDKSNRLGRFHRLRQIAVFELEEGRVQIGGELPALDIALLRVHEHHVRNGKVLSHLLRIGTGGQGLANLFSTGLGVLRAQTCRVSLSAPRVLSDAHLANREFVEIARVGVVILFGFLRIHLDVVRHFLVLSLGQALGPPELLLPAEVGGRVEMIAECLLFQNQRQNVLVRERLLALGC